MSTQTKHYTQLTQGQRYQLQALLKNSLTQQAMAGVNSGHAWRDKNTISRELSRNSGSDGYCPEAAERRKTERKSNARKAKKADDQHRQIVEIVEKGLSLGGLPENISCRMKMELPDTAR